MEDGYFMKHHPSAPCAESRRNKGSHGEAQYLPGTSQRVKMTLHEVAELKKIEKTFAVQKGSFTKDTYTRQTRIAGFMSQLNPSSAMVVCRVSP